MKNSICVIAICILSCLAAHAQAAETIKISTVFPKASPVGQLLDEWNKAVKDKSGGAVSLQISYSGQDGDEGAIATKVKSGSIGGACLSGAGLSKFNGNLLAFQLPGLFQSSNQQMSVLNSISDELEKDLSVNGVSVPGYFSIGTSYIFTSKINVATPGQLMSAKAFAWRDDPLSAAFYSKATNVSVVPSSLPEVASNLSSGMINTVVAPPLFIEQFQWNRKLDTVTEYPVCRMIGGIVLSKKMLDALDESRSAILIETAKAACKSLDSKLKGEDSSAYKRLKSKMAEASVDSAGKKSWDDLFNEVRKSCTGSMFSEKFMNRLSNPDSGGRQKTGTKQ